MDILAVLALVATVVALVVWHRHRDRRRRLAAEQEAELRTSLRAAEDDTTRFGEELQDLHWETLTDRLDAGMRQDYQSALDSYEAAKELLREVTSTDQVRGATAALEDGRYALACVLARRDGRSLPARRPPCFFDPAHGPAEDDATWAPAGGARREVPVCRADAARLAAGAEPAVRRVRSGHEMVPWWEGGRPYGAWAGGFYGAYALQGLFPAFIVGSMLGGMDGGTDGGTDGADAQDGDWSGWGDAGATEDPVAGGDVGGGDWGGDLGGGSGGGDWGGGDFGGGDF